MKKEKTYNEDELQAKAKKVFKEFTKAKVVFATTDGNVFLSRNFAELHAGPKGRVLEIERNIEPEKTAFVNELNVNDTNALIAKATLEELAKYAADERITVQRAYKARLEKLQEFDVEETNTLIATASLEELAKFATDDRKAVQDAYKARLEELGISKEEE